MYVAIIPNRGSPPAILLRESYREAGKTKNRTLANLSGWPAERIEQLRAVLRGDKLLPAAEAVEIIRALPHGHVLAALGTARRIALDAVLPRRASQRRRDLALALIVARLLEPAAKLATVRMLDPATASHSLGEMLGLGRVAAKEVYAALDWLGREQPFIEARLARRHLKNGALLLYDVTSTYLEGRCCELAQHGYSRDHRSDRPQIVIGLMCAADGCPVAVEVFEGNTADPMTLSAQIDKLKQRFKLQRVVMVGDRGLLTSARIEQTLRPAGLDWITALRAPAIRQLAAEGGPLQPSLFDDRDMAEITSSDYPGERLVVCKNPLLAEQRARKREELLAVTENDLARIEARVQRVRKPLHGAAAIGQAVGAVLGRRHMAKHFQISIGDDAFSFAKNHLSIAAEAALDGIYVVRTNLLAAQSDAAATVRAYKSLSGVEHGLGGDAEVVSGEAERVVADADLEMLGHVAPSEHRADGLADRRGAAQRLARPLHAGLDAREVVLGDGQQLFAFAGPLRSQQRVLADHQAFAGIVGAGDLRHVAVIEQRGLQRPAFGRELLDRRSPQCGNPIQTGRAQCLLDPRAGQHAAVADHHHALQLEALLQLVDLRR